MRLDRRRLMILSTGAALAGTLGLRADPALAADLEGRLAAFTGGRTPETGRITLELPEIAENGNAVPVSFTVESAMEGDDRVEAVILLADGNPNPDVATFHFSSMSGEAKAVTRMRLAASQNVVAVARMADGSLWIDRRAIEVTVGGCVG